MSNYPEGSMRGSGIYSTDEDTTLDSPCETEGCGATEGTLFVNDWGSPSIECENGHEQPLPDRYDGPDEPEFDKDAYYADKYGE